MIIVEDVPLELKGTEGIFKTDIPEAEIIGTAENEPAYWRLIKAQKPDLVLLDLGLGGSTTIGVEICRSTKQQYPDVKVLIFTGEILNEKLWVDALDAGVVDEDVGVDRLSVERLRIGQVDDPGLPADLRGNGLGGFG